MVWNAFLEDEEVQTLSKHTDNIPDEIDPKNSRTWSRMGIELYQMKKYKKSLQCFDESLKVDPYNYDSLKYTAIILISQEKLREGVICLDKILEKYPNAYEIWYRKGACYAARIGNVTRAIHSLKKAVKIKPDDTMSSYWLSQVLNDYGKFEEALQVANNLLEFKPDSEPVNYCKIHILGNLKRFEEQITACNFWLEIKQDTGIMHVKANALANLKRFEQAVIWYDNAWRNKKEFYGIENKRRAFEAITIGKVSDMPFTYHSDGKKFDFSILYTTKEEKRRAGRRMCGNSGEERQ